MHSLRNLALLLGRLMIAALFIFNATIMARSLGNYTAQFAGAGLPYANYIAIAVAVGQFAGGVMIAVGLWTRLAALVLALIAVAIAILFQRSFATDAETIRSLKEFAIVGGLLSLFASGPGRWSMDARRRSDI